jgi:hypothetical protein
MTPELPLSLADVTGQRIANRESAAPGELRLKQRPNVFTSVWTKWVAKMVSVVWDQDSRTKLTRYAAGAEWAHRIAVALAEVDRLEQQGKTYEAIELLMRIAKSARAYAYAAEFTSTPSTNV